MHSNDHLVVCSFYRIRQLSKWVSVAGIHFLAGCALQPTYIAGDPIFEAIRSQKFPVCPPVQYPPSARLNEEQGISELELIISIEGTVQRSVLIASSGHPVLDDAAIKRAQSCQFEARRLNGIPVSYKIHLKMHWQQW